MSACFILLHAEMTDGCVGMPKDEYMYMYGDVLMIDFGHDG